jgi:hypothetical protein
MSTLRAKFSIWCALNQISWEMLHDICNNSLFFLNKLYDFDSKPLDRKSLRMLISNDFKTNHVLYKITRFNVPNIVKIKQE